MVMDITIKVILGLISLLIVIRLLGKKELTQMTPFDFVYLVLLGSFLEEGLFDKKISVFHVMYAIFLWGALIYVIEKLVVKYEVFKKILRGTSTVLIKNGQIDIQALKKNNMELGQLRTMLRSQGYFSIKDIQHATLETSGMLSVLPKVRIDAVTPEMLGFTPTENEPTYLVVDEGTIDSNELQKANKTKEWLLIELQKEKINQIQTVYCAEWNESTGLYILKYEQIDKEEPQLTL